MHDTLEQLKQVWDKQEGGGRDEELGRSLADQFIADNPDVRAKFETFDVQAMCQYVDAQRAAGDEEAVWAAEAWLLHHYEPQAIGGVSQPAVRIPN